MRFATRLIAAFWLITPLRLFMMRLWLITPTRLFMIAAFKLITPSRLFMLRLVAPSRLLTLKLHRRRMNRWPGLEGWLCLLKIWHPHPPPATCRRRSHDDVHRPSRDVQLHTGL